MYLSSLEHINLNKIVNVVYVKFIVVINHKVEKPIQSYPPTTITDTIKIGIIMLPELKLLPISTPFVCKMIV